MSPSSRSCSVMYFANVDFQNGDISIVGHLASLAAMWPQRLFKMRLWLSKVNGQIFWAPWRQLTSTSCCFFSVVQSVSSVHVTSTRGNCIPVSISWTLPRIQSLESVVWFHRCAGLVLFSRAVAPSHFMSTDQSDDEIAVSGKPDEHSIRLISMCNTVHRLLVKDSRTSLNTGG